MSIKDPTTRDLRIFMVATFTVVLIAFAFLFVDQRNRIQAQNDWIVKCENNGGHAINIGTGDFCFYGRMEPAEYTK